MANADGDVKQAGLDDSNMAAYGSKEHVDARKKAAATEKEFVGAGTKVGLEVWRVENKRTASDTPDFGVKRWDKKQYGHFYTGDSYIVMNTYMEKESKKLKWDVHFWLGKESSQDEIGVAAYKAIELDDLLDDGPIQHREVQGSESELFKSYFKKGGIHYMDGGHKSGFRHVEKDKYEARLFQVARNGTKTACTFQVPVKASSLNEGDVFILDAQEGVYTYVGAKADPFEKAKGAALAHNIVSARMGKVKDKKTNIDADFWRVLGGGKGDVRAAAADKPKFIAPVLDAHHLKLFKVSDASGRMQFTKVKEGVVNTSDLDTNDVFIVDAKLEVFVWTGKNSNWAEKSQSMKYATEYLVSSGLGSHVPITRIQEGQVHHVFGGLLNGGSGGGRRSGGGGGGGFFCTIM